MRLRDFFLGTKPKLWRIGEHRVKKTKRTIPGSAPHGMSDFTAGRTRAHYECVDCEKNFKSRETFKDEECYEVIEDGT